MDQTPTPPERLVGLAALGECCARRLRPGERCDACGREYRPEPSALATAALAALTAYDAAVRRNWSPEWDTVALVAEDADGEAVWEVLETAAGAHVEAPPDVDDDAWATALAPLIAAYRGLLAREVAARPDTPEPEPRRCRACHWPVHVIDGRPWHRPGYPGPVHGVDDPLTGRHPRATCPYPAGCTGCVPDPPDVSSSDQCSCKERGGIVFRDPRCPLHGDAAVAAAPLPVSELPLGAGPDHVRSLAELRSTGLLWLVNRAVLHPRGFALALHVDEAGDVSGWSLLGDGREPWRFAEATAPDEDRCFAAVEALLVARREDRTDG